MNALWNTPIFTINQQRFALKVDPSQSVAALVQAEQFRQVAEEFKTYIKTEVGRVPYAATAVVVQLAQTVSVDSVMKGLAGCKLRAATGRELLHAVSPLRSFGLQRGVLAIAAASEQRLHGYAGYPFVALRDGRLAALYMFPGRQGSACLQAGTNILAIEYVP